MVLQVCVAWLRVLLRVRVHTTATCFVVSSRWHATLLFAMLLLAMLLFAMLLFAMLLFAMLLFASMRGLVCDSYTLEGVCKGVGVNIL